MFSEEEEYGYSFKEKRKKDYDCVMCTIIIIKNERKKIMELYMANNLKGTLEKEKC